MRKHSKNKDSRYKYTLCVMILLPETLRKEKSIKQRREREREGGGGEGRVY